MDTKEVKGTYIGPMNKLKGKTAIVKNIGYMPGRCEAQFDDTSLPSHLTHGWRSFMVEDFDIPGHNFVSTELPKKPVVIKMNQPKEWEPDEIKPELLRQRLRDW